MNHIIVTGHSKGLGAGIVTELLNENHHIHGISRTDNSDLQKLAAAKGCAITFHKCDLSHTDTIPATIQRVAEAINREDTTGIYLVNNAGVIKPIGPVPDIDPVEIEHHIRINLMAPVFLIQEFIKHFHDWPVTKRILNISSGAASNPYFGWSAYCTAKAGLEMFARCVAAEQEKQNHPVDIMSVAPGIIDTDMQTIIRGTTDEQFIHRQKFIELKQTGQLIAPNLAGKKIVQLLFSADFTNGKSVDIRDTY